MSITIDKFIKTHIRPRNRRIEMYTNGEGAEQETYTIRVYAMGGKLLCECTHFTIGDVLSDAADSLSG